MKKLLLVALVLLVACDEEDKVTRIELSYLVHCEKQVDGKGERWCYKDTMKPVEGTYQYAYDNNSTWTVKYKDGHMRNVLVENNDEVGFYRMNLVPEGERLFMVFAYMPDVKDSSASCGYSVNKVNKLVDCLGVEFQKKARKDFLCPSTFVKAASIPGCRVREDAAQ